MIQTFFNVEIIAASWPIVVAGLLNTVLLSLIVVPLGLFGGLILALLASVRHPAVRWPLMAWVDFFRAFPPLVLLILLFAGLPFAGLDLGGFVFLLGVSCHERSFQTDWVFVQPSLLP